MAEFYHLTHNKKCVYSVMIIGNEEAKIGRRGVENGNNLCVPHVLWVGGWSRARESKNKQTNKQTKQPSIMAIEANTVALWTAF